ncbi:MAG TPA: hypothetical protein DDY04_04240 [Bacteroidales bacterium]|nr:hypothetical protein [Bacteroidales bacterium]
MWGKNIKLLLLLILFNSCISYKYIDIEFFDPPQKQLAIQGDKVLVLENFHLRDTSTPVRKLDWTLDSIASNEAVDALLSLLETSPWFSGLSFTKHVVNRNDTSKVILPLTWQNLDSLNSKYGSEVIISLEYLKVRPYQDSYSYWQGQFKEFYGYIQVSIYAYWRIYNVGTKTIELGHLQTDTLMWENTDWIDVLPGNQLPGVFEACAFAGADAGEQFANLIAPQWQSDSRTIFVPNTNAGMKKAYQLAMLGNWLDAASIWQKLSSASDKRLAAKAAFNMALANEMMGKFDVAIEWLNIAKSKYPQLKFLNDYGQVLQYRFDSNQSLLSKP